MTAEGPVGAVNPTRGDSAGVGGGGDAPDWPPGRLAEAIELLRGATSLPEGVGRRLLAEGVWQRYRQGELLFRAHAPSDRWLVILRGHVALEISVAGRGTVRLLTLGPGDVVGWSAVLGGARMTTSAVAADDTEVVSFAADAVQRLCVADPLVGYHLMRHLAETLADRLVATRLQLLDLFAPGPQDRLT